MCAQVITPNKKGSILQEDDLSILNTGHTSQKNDDTVVVQNINTTPFHSTCKEEPLTSPLIKFRKRITSSEDEIEDNQSRSNLDNVFNLNINDLRNRSLYNLLCKESFSQRSSGSPRNLLKFEGKSNENLSKESLTILNELKGSILLFCIENGQTALKMNKICLKRFFAGNQELLSKIIKDITNSLFEGFNQRHNKLFFKFFLNSTKFDIIESSFNSISDSVKFLEENISRFISYDDNIQIDYNENEGEKFIFSIKGECETFSNETFQFIVSLMIFVDLSLDINNISFINEVISISEIKILILKSNL